MIATIGAEICTTGSCSKYSNDDKQCVSGGGAAGSRYSSMGPNSSSADLGMMFHVLLQYVKGPCPGGWMGV